MASLKTFFIQISVTAAIINPSMATPPALTLKNSTRADLRHHGQSRYKQLIKHEKDDSCSVIHKDSLI
jgi:hypothetical protein